VDDGGEGNERIDELECWGANGLGSKLDGIFYCCMDKGMMDDVLNEGCSFWDKICCC